MNLGFISPFPPMGIKHVESSGVASYVKNLAKSIIEAGECNISIFADKLGGKANRYSEDALDVIRCWNGGSLFVFDIARSILRERRHVDLLHIQYEVFLYGGVSSALTLPLLLIFFKALRIPAVATVHQVVPLNRVNKQFLHETGIKGRAALLKAGLRLLLRSVVALSSIVIVHEPVFKTFLVDQYGCHSEKIHVIPHGIEKVKSYVQRDEARDRLGINDRRVVLFFGYLAQYKGLDTLVDAFARLDGTRYLLYLAGGEHPRMKGTPEYDEYLDCLKNKAAQAGDKIVLTGFVPEGEIPLYFSAADVLVLPYIGVMSSSGPLALCAAYKKPFLASESLAELIEQSDILFRNTPVGLSEKIEEFFENETLRRKSQDYSDKLLAERSWSGVGRKTITIYEKLVPRL